MSTPAIDETVFGTSGDRVMSTPAIVGTETRPCYEAAS